MKSDSVVSFLRNVTVSCAKCSTAMRISWGMASPQAEADAGMGEPAGERHRRAVGAPAGRARHRAIVVKLDRVHAAGDGGHLDDVMTEGTQLRAGAFGDSLLDLERIALGPDPRRLDRLLQAHAVIDQVDQRLHRAREDAFSPGKAERVDQLA